MIGYDNASPQVDAAAAQLVEESKRHGLSLEALRTLSKIPMFQELTKRRVRGEMTETMYWDLIAKLRVMNGL